MPDNFIKTLFVIFGLLVASTGIASPKFYGITKINDGSGLVATSIHEARTVQMCQKLIDAHFNATRKNCPNCAKIFQECTTDIASYKSVWANQKNSLPYVTWKNKRYIFSGLSRSKLESLCLSFATQLQRHDKTARCI